MMSECQQMVSVPFYGVYLLCSQSALKRFQGKCYVGFTNNPNRRIEQHNRGIDFGGARKTNNKGPWKMLMIVHGFPNNVSALQFEWAWQQPVLSSRLKAFSELSKKMPRESHFDYHFRILSRMLQVEPWNRLPLTIRWLETDYEKSFDCTMQPPAHMQIVRGKVLMPKRSKKSANGNDVPALYSQECHLCLKAIENVERQRLVCLNKLCKLSTHLICMANYMLSENKSNKGHYIPIAGECPLCEQTFTWIELLQHKRKMQNVRCESDNEEDDNDEEDEEDIQYVEHDADTNESNGFISTDEDLATYELSD